MAMELDHSYVSFRWFQ